MAASRVAGRAPLRISWGCARGDLPARRAHRSATRRQREGSGSDDDGMLPERFERGDGLPPIPPPEERALPRALTEEDVRVKFARSSGPGGQSVNKTNSKADVRLNVYSAGWLPTWVRERLVAMQQNRINAQGELVVQSDRNRSQHDNLSDCLRKLQSFIEEASSVPNREASDEKKKKLKSKVLMFLLSHLPGCFLHRSRKPGCAAAGEESERETA